MEINDALQLDILRYIRDKEKLFVLFNKDVWDSAIGVAYNTIDVYRQNFGVMPTNFDTLYAFLNEYAATLGSDSDTIFGEVSSVIRHAFEKPTLDEAYLKAKATFIAQKLQAFAIVNKHIVSMTSAEEPFDIAAMSKELTKLLSIDTEPREMRRLLADINKTAAELNKQRIYKSSIPEINGWRNKGGFYAPEFYVLAAPPKALKTMTLLNFGLDFALFNKINMLYIDTENGLDNIHQRGAQNITGTTYDAYSVDQAISTAIELLREYGCDIYIYSFRPGQATYRDIETILDELAAMGIVIGGIIYDYADNMSPIHRSQKQHENAAQVYLDLIGVNMRYNTFAWTASQIKAELIKQGKFLEKGSLGQAVAKEHHAHGVYSLLGTKEERALGYRRLAPITQREGVEDDSGEHMIYVKVEPSTQRILGVVSREEVEEALANYTPPEEKAPSGAKFEYVPKVKFDNLNDK